MGEQQKPSKSDQQTKQFACKLDFEYSKLSDRLPKAVCALHINICQMNRKNVRKREKERDDFTIKERQHRKQVGKV